ncbi:hypothetical protein A2U01_0029039, partial [Trifolium medium]|nr:hypothetical protein [Trifolium medium]
MVWVVGVGVVVFVGICVSGVRYQEE